MKSLTIMMTNDNSIWDFCYFLYGNEDPMLIIVVNYHKAQTSFN